MTGSRIRPLPRLAGLLSALALVAIIGATALCGCAPLVMAGATYSAAVVYDRRSADVVLDDEVIELQARNAYYDNPDLSGQSQLRATSYAHRVLITGQAESAQIADRYARVVANLPKVTEVYNEAEIGPEIGLGQVGRDALITSRAKLAIQSIKLPGFDALRVKVVTENDVVYLMGLVTPEEADATADKVRRIPGVKRVVKVFDYIEPQQRSDTA
jgi:osmotically-inducible protein OsmY